MQNQLCQILEQHPKIVQDTAPDRMNARARAAQHPRPWTRAERYAALMVVVQIDRLRSGLCFHVDDLDEVEGYHSDLVKDLDILVASCAVKHCITGHSLRAFLSRLSSACGGDLMQLAFASVCSATPLGLSLPRTPGTCSQHLHHILHNIPLRSIASDVRLWQTQCSKSRRITMLEVAKARLRSQTLRTTMILRPRVSLLRQSRKMCSRSTQLLPSQMQTKMH